MFGLIISVGGTILSGLSFINAKAANVAINAREQFSKAKQNIELTKLCKQGDEVREKALKLKDRNCENHKEILEEIERFSFKAEEMPSFISGDGFSTYPNLIRMEANSYRREVETPGIYNRKDSIVSHITNHINSILKIGEQQ